MKRFAARLLCLCLALLLPACSDPAGQGSIESTPYTKETAKIDPALQPTANNQPPASADAAQDNPTDTTQTTDRIANKDMPDDTPANTDSPSNPADTAGPFALQSDGKVKLTDEQWRAILSTEEYYVLRQSGTEYAFTGRYLNNKDKGAYHCVGCGNKLYDAKHKFHSGCGWPSFFQEIENGSITTITDRSLGMTRTEMRCARCDGHLGHIFADAPDQPTGLRHCVNGTALIFIPKDADIKEVFREHRAKYADK